MKLDLKPARILDFDIENRPLTYIGHDFTTAEITAIAWGFNDEAWVDVLLLGTSDPVVMLTAFMDAYSRADIVTGHYIRKHDLPMINGALTEYGLPALAPKLTIDTHGDLKSMKGISKSQESLAGMLGIAAPKVGMSQAMWRAANRFQRLDQVRERVIGDVRQHQALRLKLTELGLLNPPKMWRADLWAGKWFAITIRKYCPVRYPVSGESLMTLCRP